MELRQLKYFVKVAETCNFSEASRQLNITQSTLSQQIKQLEDELNTKLLIRNSHSVRLSDVGEAFLAQAQRTLTAAETCIERIHDVQQLGTGVLNIGSTYTFSPLLKETVLNFMKLYPGVKVNIFCHSMQTLLKMLDSQKIDVVLSYKPSQTFPDIDSHIIFDNRLAVIVSDTHPLANKGSIRLNELESIPLAMPTKGMQARCTFDRLVEGHDYRFNLRVESNEVNTLLDLVRGSHMATVLSQATVAHVKGISVLNLDHKGTSMEGSFHVLRNAYMKRSTKEFLRLLCENRSYGLAMMDLF